MMGMAVMFTKRFALCFLCFFLRMMTCVWPLCGASWLSLMGLASVYGILG